MHLAFIGELVTNWVLLPASFLLALTLLFRFRGMGWRCVLFLAFFLLPSLSVFALLFLRSSARAAFSLTYIVGELARVAILPALAGVFAKRRLYRVEAILFIVLGTAFIALLPPEQMLGSGLIAHVRTLLRFCLLWLSSFVAILNVRKVVDPIHRVLVAAYCVYSFFLLPFVVIGFISRFLLPVPFPKLFLEWDPSTFSYYVRQSTIHLLFGLLVLLRGLAPAGKNAEVKGDARGAPSPYEDIARLKGLSAREKEIVALMMKGYSNPRIGETLFISQHTVRNHSHSIFAKCGVSGRIELLKLLIDGENGDYGRLSQK